MRGSIFRFPQILVIGYVIARPIAYAFEKILLQSSKIFIISLWSSNSRKCTKYLIWFCRIGVKTVFWSSGFTLTKIETPRKGKTRKGLDCCRFFPSLYLIRDGENMDGLELKDPRNAALRWFADLLCSQGWYMHGAGWMCSGCAVRPFLPSEVPESSPLSSLCPFFD